MVSPLLSLRRQNAESVTHSVLRGSTLNCGLDGLGYERPGRVGRLAGETGLQQAGPVFHDQPLHGRASTAIDWAGR